MVSNVNYDGHDGHLGRNTRGSLKSSRMGFVRDFEAFFLECG